MIFLNPRLSTMEHSHQNNPDALEKSGKKIIIDSGKINELLEEAKGFVVWPEQRRVFTYLAAREAFRRWAEKNGHTVSYDDTYAQDKGIVNFFNVCDAFLDGKTHVAIVPVLPGKDPQIDFEVYMGKHFEFDALVYVSLEESTKLTLGSNENLMKESIVGFSPFWNVIFKPTANFFNPEVETTDHGPQWLRPRIDKYSPWIRKQAVLLERNRYVFPIEDPGELLTVRFDRKEYDKWVKQMTLENQAIYEKLLSKLRDSVFSDEERMERIKSEHYLFDKHIKMMLSEELPKDPLELRDEWDFWDHFFMCQECRERAVAIRKQEYAS